MTVIKTKTIVIICLFTFTMISIGKMSVINTKTKTNITTKLLS